MPYLNLAIFIAKIGLPAAAADLRRPNPQDLDNSETLSPVLPWYSVPKVRIKRNAFSGGD